MRKQTWIMLLALMIVLVLGSSMVFAQDATRINEVQFVRAKSFKLDGNLDEWDKAVFYTMDRETANLASGTWEGRESFKAEFAFMYDNANLYFAAKVRDEFIYNPGQGGDIWSGDCVELWLSWDWAAANNPGYYQINITPANKNDVVQWYAYRNPQTQKVIDFVQAVSVLTDDGYILEVVIPLECMSNSGLDVPLLINLTFVDLTWDGIWTQFSFSGTDMLYLPDFAEVKFVK
jgi:hypothetical protein